MSMCEREAPAPECRLLWPSGTRIPGAARGPRGAARGSRAPEAAGREARGRRRSRRARCDRPGGCSLWGRLAGRTARSSRRAGCRGHARPRRCTAEWPPAPRRTAGTWRCAWPAFACPVIICIYVYISRAIIRINFYYCSVYMSDCMRGGKMKRNETKRAACGLR